MNIAEFLLPGMLIDDVTIKIKAGNGGNGAKAFNKTKMSLGPTGADGGNGGSIYLEGVSDLGALMQFRYKKAIVAKSGERGKTQLNDGADGDLKTAAFYWSAGG